MTIRRNRLRRDFSPFPSVDGKVQRFMLRGLKKSLLSFAGKTGACVRIPFGPMRGMRYFPSSLTGFSPLKSGAEGDLQNALLRLVPIGGTAIDVGANWGLHTLLLSKRVGTNGRVIAFECFPPAHADLCRHVKANALDNVTVVQRALCESVGRMFFEPGEHASQGRLVEDGTPLSKAAIEISTGTLDAAVDELKLDRIDLIKVDVEGAEGRVLQGSEKLTAHFRPTWIIELHNPQQDLAVGAWLSGHDYKVSRLDGTSIVRLDAAWPAPDGIWGTVIAVPHEKQSAK